MYILTSGLPAVYCTKKTIFILTINVLFFQLIIVKVKQTVKFL